MAARRGEGTAGTSSSLGIQEGFPEEVTSGGDLRKTRCPLSRAVGRHEER